MSLLFNLFTSSRFYIQMIDTIPKQLAHIQNEFECMHSLPEIEKALDAMAEEMRLKLIDKNPIFICLLTGAIVAFGCLLPRLKFPLEIDYVHATRYGDLDHTEELVWKALPSRELRNRTIVLFDDILDAGLTLATVIKYCQLQGAHEILTAVLLEKKRTRASDGLQKADFACLKIDDEYVFGYGLDYNGYCRNMPGIYKLKKV